MKLATLNIDNVNKRIANLVEWLARESPDTCSHVRAMCDDPSIGLSLECLLCS